LNHRLFESYRGVDAMNKGIACQSAAIQVQHRLRGADYVYWENGKNTIL
jgi:hypothetical protein